MPPQKQFWVILVISSTIARQKRGTLLTEPAADPNLTDAAGEQDILVVRKADVSRELLREGIKRLDPAERDALRMATRERQSVDTIAGHLGTTPTEVAEHLRTGLLSLRAWLLENLSGKES